jgi:hypothetical protein
VNVRNVMLLVIRITHTDNNAIEHGYDWHINSPGWIIS